MTRSVSSAWLAAARSEPRRPVYLVTVQWSTSAVEGVDQLTFASRTGLGYAASVQSVSALANQIDPLTRELTMAQSSVALRRDPAVRALVTGQHLKNKSVILRLGFVGLAESDFLTIATLRIVDATPSEHTLTLSCERFFAALSEGKLHTDAVNKFPGEYIVDMLRTRGIPPAQYTLATFQYDYDARISHWNMSHHKDPATDNWRPLQGQDFEEHSMRENVQEILKLCSATIVEDGAGVASLKRYDKDGAAVRHFARRDILDFKPMSVVRDLYNSFTVRFGLSNGSYLFKVTLSDATSQAAHAYPDGTVFDSPLTIDTEWLNGVGKLSLEETPPGLAAGFYPSSTTLAVAGAGVEGFCGARYNPNTLTIPSGAELGGGRVCYLLLTGENARISTAGAGWFDNPTQPEIIRCSAAEWIQPLGLSLGTVNGDDQVFDTVQQRSTDGGLYPRMIKFTLDSSAPNGGRCQFETSPTIPAKWVTGRTFVCDVTIAIDWIQNVMTRASNGFEDIEIRVGIEHGEIQVGDFVTLADDVFLAYGYDGADETITWEVVSDEPHALDDSPGWTFRLRRVRAVDPLPALVLTQSGWQAPNRAVIDETIVTLDGDPVVVASGVEVTRR